jgi:hypothetical protein
MIAPLADPWNFGPPEPRTVTRDDRVLAAAHAIFDAVPFPSDMDPVPWEESHYSVRQGYTADACAALDAAYPLVESAEEIDALPAATVIINEAGRVYQRILAGGYRQVGGVPVGTLEVWEQPGERETGRKVRRVTSATLAASGPWTVVHSVAS